MHVVWAVSENGNAVGIDSEKKTYQKIQNKNNFKEAAKVTTICK